MKRTIGIIMVLLVLMSVTGAWAGRDRNTRPDKPDDGFGLQIFEKELNVHGEENFVAGEILVKFKSGVVKEKINKINSKHGASVRYTSPYTGTKRVAIPEGKTVAEMVKLYQANDVVEYAEPNYIARTCMAPNDPWYSYQWHLDIPEDKEILAWHGENGGGINIEPAWDLSTGSGVIVAVIDTGVAYEDHMEFVDGPGRRDYWITYAQAPDLAGTDFVSGYDFVNDDAHPNDDEGHGTHVTGTIAQTTNNGLGVAGVAFDCSIMPVKVLDKYGSGTYADITDGIYFAANNSAQVISMSLGGPSTSTTLENALAYAYAKGVTIVCSAGNAGPNGALSYPAAYDAYCIAVGATRYDETVSYYSTTGDYVDIAAPGGDVTVDQNGDGCGDGVLQQTHDGSNYKEFSYYFYQGTSMAAPHVSGVAALLISNGVTDPDDVREALQSTAEDKGATGYDPAYGWGIVDAYAALQFGFDPKPPVADAGSDQTLSDADNDTIEAVTLNGSASYDPDGNITAYEWREGETVFGTAEVITCNFTVGTHSVTLTVTDNDNSTDSDEVIIIVEVNKAPTADAGLDRSVCVNETVTFDASGSSDPDGTITSYNWDFGDGATGAGVTTTHIYETSGTYPVSLTVTDNGGSTDTDTAAVTVVETPDNTMHVASIDMSTDSSKRGRNTFAWAVATVTIFDASGNSVEGATVNGEWSGLTSDIDSEPTGTDGKAELRSDSVKNAAGTFTFTVNSVTKTNWSYVPLANVETNDSITI